MLRVLDRLFDESRPAGSEGIAACLDDGMMAWITRGKPNADPIEIVYTNRPTRNCYGLVTVYLHSGNSAVVNLVVAAISPG